MPGNKRSGVTSLIALGFVFFSTNSFVHDGMNYNPTHAMRLYHFFFFSSIRVKLVASVVVDMVYPLPVSDKNLLISAIWQVSGSLETITQVYSPTSCGGHTD